MCASRQSQPKAKPLAGGNLQLAKADGEVPVQEYLAAVPGWEQEVARRLDGLISKTVPGVHMAVRWSSPRYGMQGQGWFVSVHVFANDVKVTFFKGALRVPVPDGGSAKEARWIDVREKPLDEARLVSWIEQASALPGWEKS